MPTTPSMRRPRWPGWRSSGSARSATGSTPSSCSATRRSRSPSWRRWSPAHPLREQFVGQLMRALAATGRTAEALGAPTRSCGTGSPIISGSTPVPRSRPCISAILRGEAAMCSEPRRCRRRRAPSAAERSAGQAGPAGSTGGPRSAAVGSGSPDEPPHRGVELRRPPAAELARIAALIEDGRLTTIVGPGGAGKTRLAVEAGRPWVDRCADGVWLVELAPVTDEATIAQAVLSALGLRDSRILERRGDGGFGMGATERVLETLGRCGCPAGGGQLRAPHRRRRRAGVGDPLALPAVRVLATSREPLGSAG